MSLKSRHRTRIFSLYGQKGSDPVQFLSLLGENLQTFIAGIPEAQKELAKEEGSLIVLVREGGEKR